MAGGGQKRRDCRSTVTRKRGYENSRIQNDCGVPFAKPATEKALGETEEKIKSHDWNLSTERLSVGREMKRERKNNQQQ